MEAYSKKTKKEVRIKHFSLILILMVSLICASTFGQTAWTNQTYNPDVAGIENNPMKGLFPGIAIGVSSNVPYSIVHVYIPLKLVYKGYGDYDWPAFEAEINKVTVKGCHAIPRFYIDFPNREYAMPTFLQSVVPASSYTAQGNGTSKLPDYNSETLMKALEDFIAAYGKKYDNDPRILMIEAGIYGFWGEWHNSGVNGKDMSQANKDRIMIAYTTAFKFTHVALRHAGHPGTDELAKKLGYYDDSYFYQTLCNSGVWCFMYSLRKRALLNNYMTHPMGGEVYPSLQETIFKAWPNTDGEDITACIKESHNSFIKAAYLYKAQPSAIEVTNAIKTAKMMGYQFFVNTVQILPTSSTTFTVNVNIQNKGVAPIYYNWPVEIAALNGAGQISGTVKTVDWLTNQIQADGKDYLKTTTASAAGAGTYKIIMRIHSPLASVAPNAKVLRFANAKQDADKSGWLTIGTVTLSGGSNPIPVNSVIVDNCPKVKLNVGGTVDLESTISPANATNLGVMWSTSNPLVATVNETTGLVTAKSAGSAVITVKTDDGGHIATCNIAVEGTTITTAVKELTDWVLGTTIAKVAGSSRLLTVMVMGESATDLAVTGVTYGGQAMTMQTEKMFFTTANRTYGSIFTLKESGVKAATDETIAVTWSATPSVGSSVYAILLDNVNQTTPVGAKASNALSGTTISTSALATTNGDMVIMCGATQDNIIQTFDNGFSLKFESNSIWGDGVGGFKMGTGVNEMPQFTQSAIGRLAICAIVVKKAEPVSNAKNFSENNIRIYPNPVSSILNIDFASDGIRREVKIFNAIGQLIHHIETTNATAQIDVKSLGLSVCAIIQVIEGNTVSTHRLIIK